MTTAVEELRRYVKELQLNPDGSAISASDLAILELDSKVKKLEAWAQQIGPPYPFLVQPPAKATDELIEKYRRRIWNETGATSADLNNIDQILSDFLAEAREER
jgi:hypothetical protein